MITTLLSFFSRVRLSQPEWACVVISLAFGLPMVLLSPPLQGIDEYSHFFRIYQFSQFDLLCRQEGGVIGDDLPRSLMATMLQVDGWGAWQPERKVSARAVVKAFSLPLAPTETTFERISAQFYTPVSYLPEILAVLPLRLLQLPPLILLYAGRLIAMLTSTLLLFFAVRIAPVLKWCLAYLAVSPLVMFIRASVAGDAIAYSLAFLFIGYALHLAFEDTRVGQRQLAYLTLLGTFVGLAKPPYVVLSGLVAVIPSRKLGGAVRRVWLALITCIVPVLVVAVWIVLVRNMNSSQGVGGEPVSASAQLAHILHHPRTFLRLVWNSYRTQVPSNLPYFTGPVFFQAVFGQTWFVPIAEAYIGGAIIMALLESREDVRLPLCARAVLCMVAAAGFLATAALAYMLWNPVGSPYIRELFPRYVVPFVPLLFVAVCNLVRSTSKQLKWLPVVYYLAAGSACLLTEAVLIGRWSFDL